MTELVHKEVTRILSSGEELEVQSIEFADKRLLFLRQDGEADTTFDVHAPNASMAFHLQVESNDDFTCDKVCLIGDNLNIKLALLVNHVAKLLYGNRETRNLIISMSSKLFHTRQNNGDFDRLIEILELVKQVV